MPDLARFRAELHGIGLALLLVAALTAAMIPVAWHIEVTHVAVIYLIPVIAAASFWGVLPALVAAVSGILAAVYFFFPPLYSFKPPPTPHLINLLLFSIVALVTGRLATTARVQAEIARRREKEMRELYAFSRRLNGARAAADIYAAIQEHLSNLIQRRGVLFEAGSGTPVHTGSAGDVAVPAPVREQVMNYARNAAAAREGSLVDDGRGHCWLVRHLAPETPTFGVIAVDLGRAAEGGLDDVRRRIDAVLAEAAETLDRLGVARVIDEARLRSETEALREALIGSVSHELRTPLASILGSATVLCNAPVVSGDDRLGALADVIRAEAERLNSDIQNLLDATRITSHSLKPRQQWVEPTDIVNCALERRRLRMARHRVVTDVPAELPLLFVDPLLLEQALVQLLDNAVKYSAPGTVIRVAAGHESGMIVLSVTDQGAGFTPQEQAHVGEQFFRGHRHIATIPGSGLGLWIAKAFVTACGGELRAESAGAGRGARVSIHLPVLVSENVQLVSEFDEQ